MSGLVVKISAQSISRLVRDMATQGCVEGRVLDSHTHAFNIELGFTHNAIPPSVSMLTVVDAGVGNAPSNIVLADLSEVRSSILPFTRAFLDEESLRIGALDILLQGAAVWEPRPDWQRLRPICDLSAQRLDKLLLIARQLAPRGTLLELLPPAAPATGVLSHSLQAGLLDMFSEALRTMEQAWREGRDGLEKAAPGLAGLGNGLTPAGDDFLVGAMLSFWLHDSSAREFCQRVARVSAGGTTRLSTCLLTQAGAGQCSASWHRFFDALAGRDDSRLRHALAMLIAHGQTSGGDALAGFFWMASMIQEEAVIAAAPAVAHASSCSALPPPVPIAATSSPARKIGTAP